VEELLVEEAKAHVFVGVFGFFFLLLLLTNREVPVTGKIVVTN
jgi:hypothetical protein